MIKLDTILYAINRDNREGNLETHRYFKLQLSGLLAINGLYILMFKPYNEFNNKVESTNSILYKDLIDGAVLWDSDKGHLTIITSDPNEANLRILLKNKEVGFDQIGLKEPLLNLLQGELKSVKDHIGRLTEKATNLQKDIDNINIFNNEGTIL